MYNNPYMNAYNSQMNLDRINTQINELEKIRNQMQQPVQPNPTNLTQNFQIAPANYEVIKYANNIEEVNRNMVVGDTPYFSKDMSVVWIKNAKGEIKTYELNEIVPKDEKDLKIDFLMAQIEELKKGMKKNESSTNVDKSNTNSNESEKSSDGSTVSKYAKKSKQSSGTDETNDE